MKQQVARFSPHQNGKVFGVLMAVTSLVFVVPMFFIFAAMGPQQEAPSAFMFLLMPVLYLVMGYMSVAIGCAIYNFAFKFIGGIEFETNGQDS
ncbi:MAG: hypothetical protein ACK4FF_09290 [Limnobacter sp.]|uniref:hypothetical protein n=1 Tax=Limnobacter sp. TaxID=2003368 RepID=UPI00391BFE02